MSSVDIAIVVFAYNEGENVDPVLTELCEYLGAQTYTTEIIFVDDGSSDDTATCAQQTLERLGARHKIVRRASNGGIGAALKSGVQHAGARFVTFLPCDGQIEPAAVTTLWQAQNTADHDLVLSVYADRDDGAHRKLMSTGVRLLIRAIHGVNLKSDGPYLFRREVFVPEDLPPDSFFLNFEFPIRALRGGLKTSTVVLHCRKRRAGVSKSTQWKRIASVASDLLALRFR